MAVTTNLGITLVEQAQGAKEVTLNAALTTLDSQGFYKRVFWDDPVSGSATITYSAMGTDSTRAYFTRDTTPHSGMRGLHIAKKSSNGEPVGIVFEYDTKALWDMGVDATTTDLVLGYSHVVQGDNIRLRDDTTQIAVGRAVGQPAILGGHMQLTAGVSRTVTNITQAASAVVTVSFSPDAVHRFAVGEQVTFIGVAGMTQINGLVGTITAMTSTTITVNINSTSFGAYTSGGTVASAMAGHTITTYGNSFGFLLLQGFAGTKRTKVSLNNDYQLGTDANQNNTADFWLYSNAANAFPIYCSSAGNVFIGSGSSPSTPTAKLHLGAGAAAASSSPLKFTSGTNMTTAENGAMEYDGTDLFFTPSGATRKKVVLAPTSPAAYTVTNGATDRSLNCTVDTLAQGLQVLGTLIADLQAAKAIG